MSDRELLELAAKAAGINVVRSRLNDPLSRDFLVNASARNPCQVSGPWNPLTDDGDALRLAVKLRMCILVRTFPHSIVVEAYNGEMPSATEALEDVRFDVNSPLAATRRAIVRAAAEIGRQMP